MADIISFPKNKIVRQNTPINEDIEKIKQKGMQNFADSFLDELLANIIINFDNYGMNLEDEKFEKDFSFGYDIIKASVYRSLNLSHPLHDFLDNHVKTQKKKKKQLPKANT
jgi:translation initiation factor IF-2